MKLVSILDEPDLEFFEQKKFIDVRSGILEAGPFDREINNEKEIKLGVIGLDSDITSLREWLSKLESKIETKEDNKFLHPNFPGLIENPNLNLRFILDQKFERILDPVGLQKVIKGNTHDSIAENSAIIFEKAISSLLDKVKVDLILCLPSIDLYKKLRIEKPKERTKTSLDIDFHDVLKAKSLQFNIPIQLLWPWTYTEGLKPPKDSNVSMQNEATIAWNFYIASYYKTFGIPWRMTRNPEIPTTCYVGISFYHNLKKTQVLSSIAQVFNEKGEGIIMRGAPVRINKDNKQINLSKEDSFKLLDNALTTYKEEHYNFPARVVLHKTSHFNKDEIDGFKSALEKYFIQFYDFLSLRKSSIRLFREAYYPPLRGTFLQFDNSNSLLYTRGSVKFLNEYPGMYVPRALDLKFYEIQSSPKKLASEILELSKMNYNNSQFAEQLPITLRTSRNVSSIIKYIDRDGYLPSSYRFYM